MPAKRVRDIGVDNIQEDFINHWEWPLEFKRLQREIIELWHACNVSLVHRTYFFLLFKGDPKDSIYMEVEQRRLSFLKDSFSRGNDAIEDGRTVSLASRYTLNCISIIMHKVPGGFLIFHVTPDSLLIENSS